MKIKQLIGIAILFCASAMTVCAQQIDPKASVQNGATNRANSKVDQGVDKGFDKVESGVGSLFKKKHKKPDSTAVVTTEPGNFSGLVLIINYKRSDDQSRLAADRMVAQVLNLQSQSCTYYENDLSTARTTIASAQIAGLMGLQDAFAQCKTPGNAVLVDPESKQVLKTMKLGTADKDVIKAVQTALKKAGKE